MRVIIFATVCLLTGCLARPPMDKQEFLFEPAATAAPKPASGSRVLCLRGVEIAEPFEGRSFVYRTGEFSFDRDPYAEFMVAPADELVDPVCDWMRGTGLFSAVEENGSPLKANTLVEIHVSQLYGDFRPGESAMAMLTMRFEFFDAPNGAAGKVILQKEYASKIPLKERTATALMDGWNAALAQILNSTAEDLQQLNWNGSKP
jgi:cholesterol transport system auxiliary component